MLLPSVAVCLRGLGGATDVFRRWEEHLFPVLGGKDNIDLFLVTSMPATQLKEEFGAEVECPLGGRRDVELSTGGESPPSQEETHRARKTQHYRILESEGDDYCQSKSGSSTSSRDEEGLRDAVISTASPSASSGVSKTLLRDALIIQEDASARENIAEKFFDQHAPLWRGVNPEYMWREDSQLWGALPVPLDVGVMTEKERQLFVKRFVGETASSAKHNNSDESNVINHPNQPPASSLSPSSSSKLASHSNSTKKGGGRGAIAATAASAATSSRTTDARTDATGQPRTVDVVWRQRRAHFINAHAMQLHDMWRCQEMLRDHEKWTRGSVPYTHVVIARMDVTFYAPHADLLGLRRRSSIGKTIVGEQEVPDEERRSDGSSIPRALTFQNLGYDFLNPRARLLRPYGYGCFVPNGFDWSQGLTDIFAVCERKAADVYLSERVSILGQPTLISKWLQTGARRIGIYNPEMLLRDTLAHFGVPVQRYEAGYFRSCYAGTRSADGVEPEDGTFLGVTSTQLDKGTNYAKRCRYLRSLKTFGKFERPPRVKKNPLTDEAVMKYADLFSATTSFDSSDQAFAYFRTKINVFQRHSILPYYVSGNSRHDIVKQHWRYSRNNSTSEVFGFVGSSLPRISSSSSRENEYDVVPDSAEVRNTTFKEGAEMLVRAPRPAAAPNEQQNKEQHSIGFTPHWKVYDSGELYSGPNRDGQHLISLYSKNVQELDARRILWRKQSAKERLAQNATFLQELLATVDLEREANKENKRAEGAGLEEEVVDYAAGIQRLLDRVVARTTKRPEPVLRLLEAGRPEEQWPGHLTGEFVVEPSGMVAQPDNILKELACKKNTNRRAVTVCQAIKEEETALFYQLRELSDHLLHYEEHLLDGTPSSATHFLETLFPYFDFRRSDFGAVP